jgi:hypothetical protein
MLRRFWKWLTEGPSPVEDDPLASPLVEPSIKDAISIAREERHRPLDGLYRSVVREKGTTLDFLQAKEVRTEMSKRDGTAARPSLSSTLQVEASSQFRDFDGNIYNKKP